MGRSLPGPGQPEIGYRHQGAGGNHHYDKHDGAEAVLVEHLDKLGQGFDRGRVEDEVHEVFPVVAMAPMLVSRRRAV
jgi:hypothetical protein